MIFAFFSFKVTFMEQNSGHCIFMQHSNGRYTEEIGSHSRGLPNGSDYQSSHSWDSCAATCTPSAQIPVHVSGAENNNQVSYYYENGTSPLRDSYLIITVLLSAYKPWTVRYNTIRLRSLHRNNIINIGPTWVFPDIEHLQEWLGAS